MHPVDLERLLELSDGSAEGMRTTVGIFLDDTRDTLAALAAAVHGADEEAIRQLAHRAGGSSAACGATRLAALLLQLESPLPRPPLTPTERESLARQVADEFAEVTRFLERHVEGLPQ